MTKKKRLLTILLAAVTAICLALGVYFLCNSNLFVLADDSVTGEKLSLERLNANSEYLIGSYIDAYGVPASAIKKSETNGDTGSGSLSGIFDRNFNTAWRSKASLSDTTASITATFYFQDPYKLEGFIYRAESGGRGYFSNLIVSYHNATDYDGADFRPFGSIKSTATGDTVHIKFDEMTEMTAIRLEWKDAPSVSGAKNASASEIVFLQPKDEDVTEALELFSDYAQLKLKENVDENSVKTVREKLQAKSKNLASWESFLDPLLNRASQIYNKALSLDPRREMGTDPESTNLLGRHGDVAGYARNTLRFSNFGTNRQATGVSARPGDVLIIYVEAEPTDPLPSLVFSQHWGTAMLNWKSGNYSLHRGRNIIVTPALQYYGCHDNNGEAVPSGGPIYLVNPYLPAEEEKPEGRTEQQQSNKVKIYIEGGTAIPTFRKGGDVDAYLSDLAEYAGLVEQDKIDNGDTLNYSVVDVTEVVCDRMTLTVQATRGDYYYNELGYDPQEACENWDDYVKKLLMFDGVVFLEENETLGSKEFQDKLDSVNGKYDSRNEWLSVNVRLMQPWGAAYAAPEHVGIQVGWDGSGLIGQGWGWGYSHEIGHMLDISERLVGESSNNMISKFDETVLEKIASRGDFAQNAAQLSPDDHMESYFNTNRLNFTIWWLIESYFPGYWTKLENLYRYYDLYKIVEGERKAEESINATEKQIFLSSIVTGIDLSYYFERWGYNLSGGNPIFVYNESSALFKRMMELGKQQNLFSEKFQPKLWYLDAAEWWERYDDKSYAENPCFDDDFDKGALYTLNDTAPSILNINQSGKSYSLMIELDEKNFGRPEHLGYEVQVKEAGQGDDAWKVVGFTYGRMFSDPNEYAVAPTYRLVAYDRALHHSAPGATNTRNEGAVIDVCKIESTNQIYNSVADAVANAKENDTIILLKDSFESGIVIDKTLTIKSEKTSEGDRIKITKCGSEPIFKVVERTSTLDIVGDDGNHTYQEEKHIGKLTLNGVILDGFKIESDGSLVLVEAGDLTVTDCTFQGGMYKYGNDSMGGALRFLGSNLTVTNTTFEGNSARLGGAVCVTHRANSVITFEGCVFKDNTAREGGGLYNTGTITLTNCKFEGNSAESVGGGFANVSGGVMKVHNCDFTNNQTDGKGGGFYADGMVELYGGVFTGNIAADGAAFCYWRTSGAARPLYVRACDVGDKTDLPRVSENRSEEGSAVTLHGQVEYFAANICDNATKYAVHLGGASVNLDGGTIEGPIFREAQGKVTLNSKNIFQNDEKIVVYTDSQEAHLVILTAGKDIILSGDDAQSFIGEHQEKPTYDAERNEIFIELDSYTVTFNIKIDEDNLKTETKHYRPGSTITLESFTGNQNQKWYVTEWRDSEGNSHKIGEKFEVTENVVFEAVVSQKFCIEFKVEGSYEGVKTQTFYAMPGEKYSLPKFEIDGYAHTGWELQTVDASGKSVTKIYQPAKSFRASEGRTYQAVIVKKFTVEYWVDGKNGLQSLCFATRSFAYGSKLTWENCDNEDYVPFGGFIEGFYIRNSDGTDSDTLIDFDTYTVTSDLVLVAKVIDETSMICYMLYDNGLTEKDGQFVGDAKFSYLPYDIDYTLDNLSIPTGYHVTSVTLNGETLTAEQLKEYTFKVVEPYYVVVANVEKNTYTVSYRCNDVPFRTETMLYGSTLTFTDPTNGLLKEAVRGFNAESENPDRKYSFINYQLVSPNPRAADPGEPENILLNVMLDDQITVTEDLTINIVAYIEGYEYKADESGSKLVEEWRSEHRQQINELVRQVSQTINDPKLVLTEEQRQNFATRLNTASDTATKLIGTTVSYTEMNAAWLNFETAANQILADVSVRAAKNAAQNSVASAMQAALKAFDGMTDEEGTVEQAKAEIEDIAQKAQSSIEANPSGDYKSVVDDAVQKMQEVVIKCNGDRLALQKANAITNVTGSADTAKRKIEALPYLSSVMKKEFKESKIDAALENAIAEINAILPESSTEEALAKAIKKINDCTIGFEEPMASIVHAAEEYNNNKLGFAEGKPDVPNRGNDLISHATQITGGIRTLLQERTADIQADGIILSNEELIAQLTAFANDKITSVESILSETLAAIAEIREDEKNVYLNEVETAVKDAKERIEAEKAAVETDFETKTNDAEQNSRSEIISLYINDFAQQTLKRFEELTLDDQESLISQVTQEKDAAVQVVQTAGNIELIKTAVIAFREKVTEIRLGAEKTSALAVIGLTVTTSDETLNGYDFLEVQWIQTYQKNISDAAETAKTQLETAAKAEDVISIGETFAAAVQKTLGEAQLRNETKGAEAKAAAMEEINGYANEKCSEIDALGFLTEAERGDAKASLKAATEEAKKNVSAAASKHDMEAQEKAFKANVEGESGILTKAIASNLSAAAEMKQAAKDEAESGAASLEKEIDALRYLTPEDRDPFKTELQSKLKQTLDKIEAAVTASGVEEAASAFGHDLTALGARATETNNAIRGNVIARAVSGAIEAVSKKVEAIRAEMEGLAFLTEETRKPFGIELGEALETAQLAIRAAATEIEISELQETHTAIVQRIGEEAAAKNDGIKAQAVTDGTAALDEAAETALSAIEALTNLDSEAKRTFTAAVETEKSTAAAKVNIAETPAAIETAVKDGKAAIESQAAKAKAEDALTKVKSDARAQLSEGETAIGEIEALGFLTEEEKSDYRSQVEEAAAAAEESVNSALTADDVSRAMTAFSSKVDSIKNAAIQRNGENATAFKEDKKAQTSVTAKEFYSVIEGQDYITKDNKELYKIRITELVQKTNDEITAAVDIDGINNAYTAFEAELEKLESEIGEANKESRTASIQDALAALDSAANAARDTVNALRGKFLGDDQINEYLQKIEQRADSAKTAIESAKTVEAVGSELDSCVEDLRQFAADAADANATQEETAKDKSSYLTQKYNSAKGTLGGLSHLTEVQKETFDTELKAAVERASTHILDAKDPDAIESGLQALENALAGIQAEAALRDAKNDALAQAKEVAEQAKAAVDALENLSPELKGTYNGSIASELASAEAAIENAESAAAATEALGRLTSSLESVKQGAEKESQSIELQEKKNQARATVTEQGEKAKQAIDGLDSLDEDAKGAFQAEIEGYIAFANAAVAGATDESGVQSALEALQSNLDGVKKEATAANDTRKEELQRAEADRLARLNELKETLKTSVAARAAVEKETKETFTFLAQEDIDAYTSEIDNAHNVAIAAIDAAETEEEANAAKTAFDDAVLAAQATALSRNAENKQAAKDEADRSVTDMVKAAKEALGKHGFISLISSYHDEIDDAADLARDGIRNAEKKDEIDTALETLKTEIGRIQEAAEADNLAATVTAKSAGKEEVSDLLEKAKESLAALGFITADGYESEINAAAAAANTAVEGAEDNRTIGVAVTELVAKLNDIAERAEAQNTLNKAAAVDIALQEIASGVKNAKQAVNALIFLNEKGLYLEAIDAAADGEELLRAASSSAALDTAKAGILNAISAEQQRAETADAATKTDEVNAAKDTVTEETAKAKREIGALGFVSAESYNVDEYATKANAAIDSAADRDHIHNALTDLENGLNTVKDTATADNEKARATAVSDGKGQAETQRAGAENGLEALGFIDAESYRAQINTAATAAALAIDNAARPSEIASALQTLTDALAEIATQAKDANDLAKRAAVNTALREIETAKGEAEETIAALRLLTDKTPYTDRITAAADTARTQLEDPANMDAVNAAKAEALAEFEKIESDAQAAHNDVLQKIEAAIEAAKKTLSELKEKIEKAIKSLGFLRGGSSLALMAIDETTKESFLAELEAAYNDALEGLTADNFTSGAGVESYLEEVSAKMENVQTDAEAVNQNNQASVKEDAQAKINDAKAKIEELLKNPDLPAEKKAEYQSELGNVLSRAQSALESADGFGAVEELLTAFHSDADMIEEMIQNAITEDATVQIIVEGIRAIGRDYNGTDSIEFDLTGVVYRNAATGEVITEEFTQDFVLTVSGRLSDYNAGKQIALITSITLESSFIESGEITLAPEGQQAFAEVEIEKTRLVVRANGDGSVTYEGFVNGEDESVLTGELVIERNGNVLTPRGLESTNYDIVFVSETAETDPAAWWLGIAIACMSLAAACAVFAAVYRKKQ